MEITVQVLIQLRLNKICTMFLIPKYILNWIYIYIPQHMIIANGSFSSASTLLNDLIREGAVVFNSISNIISKLLIYEKLKTLPASLP